VRGRFLIWSGWQTDLIATKRVQRPTLGLIDLEAGSTSTLWPNNWDWKAGFRRDTVLCLSAWATLMIKTDSSVECRTMPIEYDAQILKLRLPEQDELKNDAECCSADPAALNSIGCTVGHQIRIERKDDPRFFALYTVKLANPPEDVSDPSRVNVVRTGQAGRERLGHDC
jgi:hypothetical protein